MTGGSISAHICIVGGGLVGCATALALSEAGEDVILLERGRVNTQASGVNFGGVRCHGRDPAELPLALMARSIWSKVEDRMGVDIELMTTGHIKLARSDADMEELERWALLGRSHGLEIELLDRPTLRGRFPWLDPNLAGASLCPGDGHANPRLAGLAFARAARSNGARIFEEQDVVGIVGTGAGRFRIETASGLTIVSDILVNAAGAWGVELAAQMGDTVTCRAVAPQMFVTEPAPYRIKPVIGMVGAALYLRQIPRGNVIFGGGRGMIFPDGLRSRPLEQHFADTAGLAHRLIPHLRHIPIIRSWTGIEGNMIDGLPVIGESPNHAGLFHVFGMSGHGFQMAPAVGQLLSDLIVHGNTGIDLMPFRVDRFSRLAAQHKPAAPARPAADGENYTLSI